MRPAPTPPSGTEIDGHPRLWQRQSGSLQPVAVKGSKHDIHFIIYAIAERGLTDESVADYAAEHELEPEDVWAALVYFFEHQDELSEYVRAWRLDTERALEEHSLERDRHKRFLLAGELFRAVAETRQKAGLPPRPKPELRPQYLMAFSSPPAPQSPAGSADNVEL
jgi:hypothetical protein